MIAAAFILHLSDNYSYLESKGGKSFDVENNCFY